MASTTGEPKRISIALFRAWGAVRDTPIGRLLRRARSGLDPVVYAAWYAYRWFETRHPITFNEKIRHKMVRDRRPVLTLFTDKIGVRDHVEDSVGADYLTKLFQVSSTGAGIRWDDLPREFACKVNHASGGVILVTETADPQRRLPRYIPSGHGRFTVHPDSFDRDRAVALLERWLTSSYGWSGWKREWGYRGVRPRALCEEFLRGPDGGVPLDFKFHVFDGYCRAVEVHRYRFTGRHVADMYTRDWEYMPVDYEQPRSDDPQPPPSRLADMLCLADRLGAGTDYVRVDLYVVGDRIVFGEMTNYPAAGLGPFDPHEYDELMGSWWKLPGTYR